MLLTGIEENKSLKTRHSRIQPVTGSKINNIKQNIGDLLNQDLEKIDLYIETDNTTRQLKRRTYSPSQYR